MTYQEIIEVESAKERFMGNYQMFSMYLYQFAQGALFADLKKALKNGDPAEAFDVAHDMKGVALNLSLKPIEAPMSAVVEALRGGRLPDAAEWKALEEAYTFTAGWIEKLKAEGTALF